MRRKNDTKRGITRVPCAHCGRPSVHQWQVCADGNQYRGLCWPCDVELNQIVLGWMSHALTASEVQVKMLKYIKVPCVVFDADHKKGTPLPE